MLYSACCVWRKMGAMPTVKYRHGSVTTQGCFSAKSTKVNRKAVKYQNILEKNLISLANMLYLGRRWTCQQDNNPKHTEIASTSVGPS